MPTKEIIAGSTTTAGQNCMARGLVVRVLRLSEYGQGEKRPCCTVCVFQGQTHLSPWFIKETIKIEVKAVGSRGWPNTITIASNPEGFFSVQCGLDMCGLDYTTTILLHLVKVDVVL